MLKDKEHLSYRSVIALTVLVAPAAAAFSLMTSTTAEAHSVIYSLIIL